MGTEIMRELTSVIVLGENKENINNMSSFECAERVLKVSQYMDRAMRKCVFGHMRTAKAQINLRIRAV